MLRLTVPFLLLAVTACSAAADAPDRPLVPGERIESLTEDRVFGRKGPSRGHAVEWVYARKGLPVRVLDESNGYRKVEDPAGGQVWIHESKLSSKRTAYVRAAGARGALILAAPRPQAKPVARLQTGVIGVIVDCVGSWRKLSVEGREGWLDAQALWGAGVCGPAA